jgi:FAD/FMN-containing dehydrogenase/Fe-S oxidoreductase
VKGSPGPPPFSFAEARALREELAGEIEGEVRFDAGSRALYAHDLSIYRQVPIGVVLPRSVDDVVATLDACRRHGAPVLPRGGGTSLVGQCTNVAVVIDFSKYMNRILEVDVENKRARVEPGVVCDRLKDAAEPHHLTYGPDPATHAWCTFGGMIGNNSCGVHSVLTELYGQGPRTSDNVEELEILTYDGHRMRVGATSDDELEQIIRAGGRRGEIYGKLERLRDRYGDGVRERYPDIPRRVSGYNLDELLPENGFHVARSLVGSEGTCGVIVEATVSLVEWPPVRTLVVLGYPDHFSAADDLMDLLEHGPIGLEGFDASVTETMEGLDLFPRERAVLPEGGAWLLVELGGQTREEGLDRSRRLVEEFRRKPGPTEIKLFAEPAEQKMVWLVRESALGASRIPRKFETWPSFEDSAVHPSKLGAYLRDFQKVLDRHGYRCVYFGHYGQGCVHCRINFDLRTSEGLKTFRHFLEEASDLVLSYGGSLTGEHGDGQAHGHHLTKMFGEEVVEGFREFKSIWDPDWKLNPGKLIDAYPVDANLRVGPDYRPRKPVTIFSFHEDGGSLAAATERCFGMGKCRKTDGGTMCPSYMATLEEKHTTRGRAHLLFEMVRGEVIGGNGWRDDHVKESLDLCLSCKACKGECPVHVDIATYKAEFLSHYYARRLRPRPAYALGLISWWARLGSRAPRLANALTQTPALARVAKAVAGIASERPLPRIADQTFVDWFRERGSPNAGVRRVLVWPDTFVNYMQPEVAQAAVEVLEAAGFRVELPGRSLCCGRPLYDYGMLTLAKRQLRQVLDELRPQLAEGVAVVALEPACLSVFRDELVNLFPDDEDAARLARQSLSLAELLVREGYEPPSLRREALVHGHCHHKAVVKMDADEAVLSKLGLDFTVLDSGCCGLAGSFGYEKGERYDVSMKAGERILLPAVRSAPKDALIVADGFSCRQQIAQATDRRALHLAQVIQMALREGEHGPPGDYPEARFAPAGEAAGVRGGSSGPGS